jgi:hypothetical protein
MQEALRIAHEAIEPLFEMWETTYADLLAAANFLVMTSTHPIRWEMNDYGHIDFLPA